MKHYLQHISNLNKKKPVVASRDIVDATGKSLVLKGERINESRAEILAEAVLIEPLDINLSIGEPFSPKTLERDLKENVYSDFSYRVIFENANIDDCLQSCCEHLCTHPQLWVKLKVLSYQLPQIYQNSLFCAWMSIILGQKNQQSETELHRGFIIALFHDIGLLDISPEIFNKSPRTNIEKKIIEAHPQLSHAFLSTVDTLHRDIARAALEHHERIDGSGYPSGKVGRQLGRWGQMINLLDTTNAIYRKHFKPRRRTMGDVIPIIEMSTLPLFGGYAYSLVDVLDTCDKTDSCSTPREKIADLVNIMKNQHVEISGFLDITGTFIDTFGLARENARLFAVLNVAVEIKKSMSKANAINSAYMRWLDQVIEKELIHAHRELEDVYLTMQEILFHIDRFKRQLFRFSTTDHALAYDKPINALLLQLSTLPQHQQLEYIPEIMKL